MKTFEFKGKFKMGDDPNRSFHKKIKAESKEKAKEKLYALLGSEHKCPRRFIKIENG